MSRLAATLVAVAALAATGAPAAPGGGGSTTVAAYFHRAYQGYASPERLAVAHRTARGPAVATAAMRALLAGPSASERRLGLVTAVPAGTRLLGLSVRDGIARVDLSRRFASGGGALSTTGRLDEVVYTLTQFPTVRAVRFLVGGRTVDEFMGLVSLREPLRREPPSTPPGSSALPDVFVESVAPGDSFRSPLRVAGSARGTFLLEVLDGRWRVVARRRIARPAGARSAFAATVAFRAATATGALRVFQPGPGGTRRHLVRIPLG